MIRSLGKIKDQIASVSVLGAAAPAEWRWEDAGLSVRYPAPEVSVPLHVVKIGLK